MRPRAFSGPRPSQGRLTVSIAGCSNSTRAVDVAAVALYQSRGNNGVDDSGAAGGGYRGLCRCRTRRRRRRGRRRGRYRCRVVLNSELDTAARNVARTSPARSIGGVTTASSSRRDGCSIVTDRRRRRVVVRVRRASLSRSRTSICSSSSSTFIDSST